MLHPYNTNSKTTSPFEQICNKEFAEGVYKAGSLLSMLENKKLNPINLFLQLFANQSYQIFFTEITSSSCFKEAILNLLYLYPSIVKSKITKRAIKSFNNDNLNKT